MRKFDLFVIVISLVAYLAAESSGFKVVNRYKRGDDEAASADSFTDMTTVNAETEIPESDYPTESTKLNSQEDVPELEEVRLPTESEDSSTPTVSIEPKTAVTSETQPITQQNRGQQKQQTATSVKQTTQKTHLPESSSTEAGYEQATQIVELLDESTDLRTTTDADDYLSQTNEPENGWAYITGSSEYPLSESSNDETTKAYDDTEPVVTEIDPSWGEKPESLDDEKDEPSVGAAVPNLPVPSAPAYPEPVVTEINPSWSENPESLDVEKDEPTVGAAVPNLPVPSAPVYPEPVVTEIDSSWGEKPESLDDEKDEPTVGVAVPNLPVPSAPAYPEAPVAPIAPSYPSAPANPADAPCDDAYVPVVQPVYQDVYYNPSFGPDVPNTLYSLGGASSYPVVNYPNPVQPAQVHPVQVHPAQVHPYYQQSAPNYEYSPQQSAYGTSGYAQQPLIPVAYAPYPNQPQYSNDPEIESLLQFTFNNYRDYQQTLVTGQRPEEAPCVC
ncbi:proteoglycan 4-like [Sitodiplosis mosellana]|uniref:proteoglycan 4-like n=1 Tax=Sitodiplosis mosellana TaxID=263140 RepID=UPI002444BC04|nr:proteoglycan 4-like [Sitodiplosis mosellana]